MFENISTVYIIESASQHLHFFFSIIIPLLYVNGPFVEQKMGKKTYF